MPKKPACPLPRSECLCAICREILLEPVTLPCNHTLCRPCFQMTVEKASLCCPFCRLRVSSWARRNARSGTLINKELWEVIQRQFPEECSRRACGLDTEEDEFEDGLTPYPTPQLCNPGEIRKEYEDEISKIETERLKREEEEQRASEEYIQKLLAEEEAEQRSSLERLQRELEEQMKKDEELAWMLNSDLNESTASSARVSPVESPVIHKKTVSTKSSCKSMKSNRIQTGDIERFLSPKSEKIVGTENCSNVRNGDLQNISTSSSSGAVLPFLEKSDDAMPTLSPQYSFTPNTNPTEGSDSALELPDLAKYTPTKCALKAGGSSACKYIEKPVTDAVDVTLTTAGFSPPRCSSSLDDSGKWQSPQCLNIASMPEQWHKLTPKRTFDFYGDSESHPSEKRPCLDITPLGYHTEKLMELEETLHERKLQEEQDRLLALKLQKLLDKEVKEVSRQRGSPDEYKLRSKRTTQQQEPLDSTELKMTALNYSADKNYSEISESNESSDENKKPAPRNHTQSLPGGARRERNTSEQPLSPNGVKILKPSNKQQTIMDMFQRATQK